MLRHNSPICITAAGVKEKVKKPKVRSGFEKDVNRGRSKPFLQFETGMHGLGDGTMIAFYPQAFADDGKDYLAALKVCCLSNHAR